MIKLCVFCMKEIVEDTTGKPFPEMHEKCVDAMISQCAASVESSFKRGDLFQSDADVPLKVDRMIQMGKLGGTVLLSCPNSIDSPDERICWSISIDVVIDRITNFPRVKIRRGPIQCPDGEEPKPTPILFNDIA